MSARPSRLPEAPDHRDGVERELGAGEPSGGGGRMGEGDGDATRLVRGALRRRGP